MVDENEVNRWIARLETEESSWTNYERLAVLYAIRDQQSGSRERALPMAYSATPAPVNVETYGDSDFLRDVYKRQRPAQRRRKRVWNLSPARSSTVWRRLWAK